MTLQELMNNADQELNRYLDLEPGWDGYTGKPFSNQVIYEAKIILDALESHFETLGGHPSEVTPGPCPDGSVELVIKYMDKEIAFTIKDDVTVIEVYRDNGKGDECEYDCIPQALNLHREIFWLTD